MRPEAIVIDRVARAIHEGDYAGEPPCKTFDKLHPDDQEHYRIIAGCVIERLGLHEERRASAMSSGAIMTDYKTGITTGHSDCHYETRLVSNWGAEA